MKSSEAIGDISNAEVCLKDIGEFLRTKSIDGCMSYLYACALLRYNDAQKSLDQLRTSMMEYCNELEKPDESGSRSRPADAPYRLGQDG